MGHWAEPHITKGLVQIEKELSELSGQYSIGDEVTIADVCLVPQLYGARRFGCDMSQFPRICAVEDRLKKHPAFEAADAANQPDAAK